MTFTLRSLMGVTAACALLMAWGMLIRYGTPQASLLWVILASAALAIIVGYRRFGTLSKRISSGVLFLFGGVIISYYSCLLTWLLSENATLVDRYYEEFYAVFVVFGFPIVFNIAVFMLRAWFWSANDRSIHAAYNKRV